MWILHRAGRSESEKLCQQMESQSDTCEKGSTNGCFGVGRGPETNECGQPLDSRKDKEMDSLLEPPKEMEPWSHLDFSPVRPILGF